MKKLSWRWVAVSIAVLAFLGMVVLLLHSRRENFGSTSSMEIVAARYNESLEWLKDAPFQGIPHTVYNKGNNDDFYQTTTLLSVVPLDNVGREVHAYLYHIVNRYDDLADLTIFLPGSADLPNKFGRAQHLVKTVRTNPLTTFSGSRSEGNIKDGLYDFSIDKYMSSHGKNKTANADDSMLVSSVRPFGKWYETLFGPDAVSYIIPYNAMFAVTRNDIRSKPKSHYERLLTEVDAHQNHETVHYFERAWETVFFTQPKSTTVYVD